MRKILHKPISIAIALFLLMLFMHPSYGTQLYRYKDDQGNYVLNHTIPPQFVDKGYEILNRQGRVIETVAPALTAEEIAARDARIEQERLAAIEKAKQDVIDAELKQLYSHPDDAVRVLKRKLADIQSIIQVKKGHISGTESKILAEEEKAAQRQRKGWDVEESTLERIAKLRSDITNSQQDIQELLSEQEKVREDFSGKIKRLEIITGRKATVLEAEEPSSSPPDTVGTAESPDSENSDSTKDG